MSELRKRINKARKTPVVLCMNKVGKSVWGTRSLTTPGQNIQIEVLKSKHITSVNGQGKISHGLYICVPHRINKYNEWEAYFGTHALEYAVASILGEAKRNKKTIIFYKDLKSVMLKKKIQDVSMIEIRVGKEKIWGVVSN